MKTKIIRKLEDKMRNLETRTAFGIFAETSFYSYILISFFSLSLHENGLHELYEWEIYRACTELQHMADWGQGYGHGMVTLLYFSYFSFWLCVICLIQNAACLPLFPSFRN